MKVLLLDPAFSAIPIHSWLESCDFEVWTIGNRPSDPLALANPERWIQGDYSDVQAVRWLIDRMCFDAVVPGCTDVSMDTFVRLGFEQHYRHDLNADQILNKKDLFRRMCHELDLPSPRIFHPHALPNSGRLICKPVDGFSGRGVAAFDACDERAMHDAIKGARHASPNGAFLCEEFVEGQLYSYSAYLEGGRVAAAFSVREGSQHNPFAVDVSYLMDTVPTWVLDTMRRSAEQMADFLALCDGLLHIQYICNDDRIAILEATRRCPGDLYSLLIEYSTGFPYAARYASYFVGRQTPHSQDRWRHVLRRTIKQSGEFFFKGSILESEGQMLHYVPVVPLGQRMDSARPTRTGLLFLNLPDRRALEREYERVVSIS